MVFGFGVPGSFVGAGGRGGGVEEVGCVVECEVYGVGAGVVV